MTKILNVIFFVKTTLAEGVRGAESPHQKNKRNGQPVAIFFSLMCLDLKSLVVPVSSYWESYYRF